ncbi:uncharacterized protein LOC117116878 isoform X2 [Anneissia japonica]|uniref:uncharacterized protein LOC117116878 isoform X2 n=1 Tax=Anneissia japonica TaxID=1529436 RepID=UPI0014255290|nr:uncharacterized protein LOC117116878 isoform X2 [Anneissia japonica]
MSTKSLSDTEAGKSKSSSRASLGTKNALYDPGGAPKTGASATGSNGKISDTKSLSRSDDNLNTDQDTNSCKLGQSVDDKGRDINADSRLSRIDDAWPSQEHDQPLRLLILSSKIKNYSSIGNAILPNVKLVQYRYEGSSLDAILNQVGQTLGTKQVHSVACVLHTKPGSIVLCSSGDQKEVFSVTNLSDNAKQFFTNLATNYIDASSNNKRIDFIACNALQPSDITVLTSEIEKLVGMPVGISREIHGNDISVKAGKETVSRNVGEFYFKTDKLKNWNSQPQTLAGFEKIRTVGKGAYGAAVLYRKKDDDSLVILKEINMHDLTAAERQMALNEVRVLSMLDHPNIISYYDSFEEDGTLMIEMEYADGGTLSQFLSNQQGKRELEEREILLMYQQMVTAIRYIHDHNVLHRDLKTANIFLTKEGIIKMGDFGIAKVMSSNNRGANTVLGTPYYISPEICEGKPYNDKSDIWALGCILYEMACLQKTFEGTNLPALVNKIMKGHFTPVKGNYSQEFKTLIQDMLQREPEYRPSANELMLARLPILLSQFEDPVSEFEDDLMASTDSFNTGPRPKTRSVLYHFDIPTLSMYPVDLPSRIKIKQVAICSTHMIVVTYERSVFSWGEGLKGQLGHGDLKSRQSPEVIEALKGKSITKACCGDGFSVFASDNGIVMTCGDGSKGCLGHGDWSNASRPRLIETLLSVDVTSIDCGPHHVVAVGADGEVFSWGVGKDGRLGLGDEENHCEPQAVDLSAESVYIRMVKCGRDGTMFLSDMGSLLACGNNEFNKLGLNNRQGFLMAMKNIFTKTEVDCRKVPTVIKPLSTFRVLDMMLGQHHSAVIIDSGIVYTFGKNSDGQLGTGDVKSRTAPAQVRQMADKSVKMITCSEHFTVAGTDDNHLYMWGRGFKISPPPSDEGTKSSNDISMVTPIGEKPPVRSPSVESLTSMCSNLEKKDDHSYSESKDSGNFSAPDCISSQRQGAKSAPVNRQRLLSGDNIFVDKDQLPATEQRPPAPVVWPMDSPRDRLRKGSSVSRKTVTSVGSSTSDDKQSDSKVILQPTPILMFDSTGSQSAETGECFQVVLNNVLGHGDCLLLQVETTAPPPPPRRRSRKKKKSMTRRSSGQNLLEPGKDSTQSEGGSKSFTTADDYTSSETSEADTLGTIPTWLKKEMRDSLPITDDNDADDSDDETGTNNLPDASMANIKINKDIAALKGVKNSRDLKAVEEGRDVDTEEKAECLDNTTKKGSQELRSSDSSSSDVRQPAVNHSRIHGPSRLTFGPQPPIHAPNRGTPYKQQKVPVPGAHRPMRMRAGRGRGRTSSWTIDGKIQTKKEKESKLIETRKNEEEEEKLRLEVQRLQEEKLNAEARLQAIEKEYEAQRKTLLEGATNAATNRENALKTEIEELREELKNQVKQMKDNNAMVVHLQQELIKMQSEQIRTNARDKRAESTMNMRKKSTSNQSKVCVLS